MASLPAWPGDLSSEDAADLDYGLQDAAEDRICRLTSVWLIRPNGRPDHECGDRHAEYKTEHEDEQTGYRDEVLSHRMLKPLTFG